MSGSNPLHNACNRSRGGGIVSRNNAKGCSERGIESLCRDVVAVKPAAEVSEDLLQG